ncbi:archaeosine tRNA-ribosyltransferase [Pyrodictium delaneyi]|uniref:tRNA-guanine(15) transglycosylase n=1 Tax=Pyrodictium delaneyi TaxID=1273541 RepID=A0A0P0N1J1_9CREN|nr:tRNA guanosine(15) transglycosylase TgtA [Pyrodictium delaneyi]ALL00116.1 archaeosine tRNA-ribosyltransferase [Pyrodictium delaneyi]OWJ54712.1 tRNA guanosine(15) transglycosylase TgtA [Pyrodictium delaneyi]
MNRIGVFEIKDKDLAGRIGKLYTPHGILETPALLPVIDIVRQEVSIKEIESLGFNAVITNAYLLWKRMRSRAVEQGVHGILGFNGIIMTDSGAYQILQYGRVSITPGDVIDFQKKIGSDIAVILDIPTGNTKDPEQARYSVEETLRRAREALSYIDDNRIWTLPVQGGPFLDLLEKSARESAQMSRYRLYALGSPTVLLERYDYATLVEMIYTVRLHLPRSRPLHLFGAGHPMIIPFAVALGVDMFDSASYILYARDNRYMTLSRTYRLDELEYFPCSCPVCTRYTPQDLREMPKQERTRLIALHNLYVLRTAINEVKTAIREGRLWELLEERSKAHPSLARAFSRFRRYSKTLARLTPRVKGSTAKGIFLYGGESVFHPKLVIHHERLLSYYRPRKSKAILIPVHPLEKPFTTSRLYRMAIEEYGADAHIVGYSIYIGVIPEELAETYPLSQYELNDTPYIEVIEQTAHRIYEYIQKNSGVYRSIVIMKCGKLQWSAKVVERLVDMLKGEGIVVEIKEHEC